MEKLEFFKRQTTEFYFIRHPEVENYTSKVFNGHIDIDLSENGFKQALKLANFFEYKNIKLIYTSPLKRCLRTAYIIKEKTKCDIIVDDRLKERSFGIFESLSWEEIEEKYPKEAFLFLKDPFNYKVKGGESFLEIYERVSNFFKNIEFKDNLLIVAHGGINRVIIKYLLGLENEKILSISQDFACINYFITDGSSFLAKLINGSV